MTLLKHVSTIRVSNVDKKSHEGEMPVRLCNYTDVYYGDSLRADDGDYMSATASIEQIGNFRLRSGDTVLTKDSETVDDIGVSAYIERAAPDFICGYHLAIVRPRESLIEPRFLFWASRSASFTNQLSVAATGVTRYGLRSDAIANVDVSLPPREEQRRIADFLDDQVAHLDRAVALRERQSSALIARRNGEVRSLLTGQTRPDLEVTNSRWFPRLPVGWAAMQLKYRWQVIDCKHRTPAYQDDGYPLVSTGDITAGRLDLTKTSRFVDHADFLDLADRVRRPVRGDIVYSRNASLGTASYVDTDEPFTMGQDVCRITSEGDQLYLCHVLNFLAGEQVEEGSVGSTFKRINIERIRTLEVPVPPNDEQQAIARLVDRLLEEVEAGVAAMRRSVELLSERKQALITAAVGGRFDVTTAQAVA